MSDDDRRDEDRYRGGYGRGRPGRERGWRDGDYDREGESYGRAGGYNQEPGRSGGEFRGGRGGGGRSGGGFGYTGQTGTGWGRMPGGFSPQDFDRMREHATGLWGRSKQAMSEAFGEDDDRSTEPSEAPTGSHRGRGPKGYSRSDERIRDDVNDRLTDDPFLDATHIEVSVAGGEVTLAGTVTARGDKRRAEDLADEVSGVKHVQNNLRVQDASAG